MATRKPPRRVKLPADRAGQRHIIDIKNQGYGDVGASTTRRATKGFNAWSASPARDIDENNMTLRQRCRMLYMGAPIATSAIRTNRTNIVGTGLVPKSNIDSLALGLDNDAAIAWQKKAEREFALWADRRQCCDATGMNNFYGLQQLALMSWLMSGDVFALVTHTRQRTLTRPYGLRLHLIEADRVRTPTSGRIAPIRGLNYTTAETPDGHIIYDGVEVDKGGNVLAYWVSNTYPEESPGKITDFTRVKAYGKKTGLPNILHLMDAERPEQYRGVSVLAQVIEPLLNLRRYTEAELIAAIIEGCYTAFIQTDGDPTEFPFDEMTPEDLEDEEGISESEHEYELGPGQINVLKPGETVSFGDPKRPASGFSSFADAVATQIGAALEIPRGLLLKEFKASYSASRAELMEAWKAFRMRRAWFVDDFCRPVWELWMSEAVALGRLDAPGFFDDPAIRQAYLGCEWVGPSQGQLDPSKEISAMLLAVKEGFITRESAAEQLNGSSWDANIDRLDYENKRMADANGITDTLAAAVDQMPTDQAVTSITDRSRDDETT